MDEFKNVRMLQNIGADHKANETYKLDAETANKWITAGLGEEVVASPEDALVERLSKAMEERDEKLVASLSKAVARTSPAKVPAVAKDASPGYWGEYLNCIATVDAPGPTAEQKQKAHNILQDKYAAKATLVTTTGELGGHLIPPQFYNQLMVMEPYAEVVRPRAWRVPVSAESVDLPTLNQSSGFDAGIDCYWEGEIENVHSTDTAFGKVSLKPKALRTSVSVSNKLLSVSPISVDAIIRRLFFQRVAKKCDKTLLFGDGVNKPLGITNSSAAIFVPREANGEIKFADTVKMFSKLPLNSWGSAVWIASQTALPTLMNFQTTAGYLSWVKDATVGPPMTLHGIPLVVSEVLPVLGNTADLVLADLSYLYLAELQTATISLSEHIKFMTSETVFKLELYMDAQSALQYKIPLDDGSGTTFVSPYVVLEEYSS